MCWYVPVEIAAFDASGVQAVPSRLYLINSVTASGDVLPPPLAAGNYFGVAINPDAELDGKIVSVEFGNGEAEQLYCEGQVIWLAADMGALRYVVVAREDPAPNFGVRLRTSLLGSWELPGNDATVPDRSGNAKDLSPSLATMVAGAGLRAGERCGHAAAGNGWFRNDATMRLFGAMSFEALVRPNGTTSLSIGGAVAAVGTGSGGAANNYAYRIGASIASSVMIWNASHQHGVNVSDALISNLAVNMGWQHILATRTAPSGGNQEWRLYLDGREKDFAVVTEASGASSSQFLLGNVLACDIQMAQLWSGRVVTAAEAAYLARLRLGRAYRT